MNFNAQVLMRRIPDMTKVQVLAEAPQRGRRAGALAVAGIRYNRNYAEYGALFANIRAKNQP